MYEQLAELEADEELQGGEEVEAKRPKLFGARHAQFNELVERVK